MLANCGFATVFAAPKLAGLRHLMHIARKVQCYGSPKSGLSEANYLATVVCQSEAMVLQNCCSFRLGLEKAVAVIFQATILAYHLKPFAGF
jgi:hypothetical protein